jgi:hypothetical protein
LCLNNYKLFELLNSFIPLSKNKNVYEERKKEKERERDMNAKSIKKEISENKNT